MILKNMEEHFNEKGVPRVGGGDPILDEKDFLHIQCSPRRRG